MKKSYNYLIAKEFLIILSCIVTIAFLSGLNSLNTKYQSYGRDKEVSRYDHKISVLERSSDSLSKTFRYKSTMRNDIIYEITGFIFRLELPPPGEGRIIHDKIQNYISRMSINDSLENAYYKLIDFKSVFEKHRIFNSKDFKEFFVRLNKNNEDIKNYTKSQEVDKKILFLKASRIKVFEDYASRIHEYDLLLSFKFLIATIYFLRITFWAIKTVFF